MTVTRPPIVGVAAAPGIALGRWAEVGRPPLPEARRIDPSDVADEIARIRSASIAAADELHEVAATVRGEGHEDEAEIFEAHALMARDPSLVDGAARRVETDLIDAAGAVMGAAREVADSLGALDDELLSARAADVLDVGDRIARRAAGMTTSSSLDQPAVVVAEDLPPSVTATLPREHVLGICLERSSPTAHAAILARAYGIPAVVGVSGLLAAVRAAGPEAELALDGTTGEVVIAPDAADRARFEALAAAAASARTRDLAEATAPAATRDGVEVTLLANIGNPEESDQAVALGAVGVGLFRTEFLFLERTSPPTEEEQLGAYRRAVEAFAGGVVTVRLLDVGGDKPIPYLPMPREENPFLGVRALRLAADRPDLFVTQLRACYRAAVAGPVRIMAPMIADATDAATLISLAERAREELTRDGIPLGEAELGVMLEIPSAVLTAGSYFDEISFASLGTNDLLQYALAVDRGNPALERYRDAMHPGLLRLVRLAVEAADERGVSLSVCGEMAGDPIAALALVGLGIRSLSMSATSLPAVRRAIRQADAAALATEANAALSDRSAADARTRIRKLLAD
jgi:phosphoenolpyruvate-protein phosphotransferase (PTS system enzyme I)